MPAGTCSKYEKRVMSGGAVVRRRCLAHISAGPRKQSYVRD
jgi:hypothetical protein